MRTQFRFSRFVERLHHEFIFKETGMSGKKTRTWLFMLAFSLSASAWADCVYMGKLYPTGTKIGGLTCQKDGNWR